MKFTLIATHLTYTDLTEHRTSEPSEFGLFVAEATANAATVAEGIYLFDTNRDYADIHRLCEGLRIRIRNFVLLHFEEEICGGFDPKLATELSDMGLTVKNVFSKSKTQ